MGHKACARLCARRLSMFQGGKKLAPLLLWTQSRGRGTWVLPTFRLSPPITASLPFCTSSRTFMSALLTALVWAAQMLVLYANMEWKLLGCRSSGI